MHGARPLRSTRRLANLQTALPGWYTIRNAGDGPAVVSIYDEIGLLGVSAASFMDELRQVKGDIELHLNTPGGDVFDGIAIHNQLRRAQARGKVHVIVDGLAASAGSFIAMAASPGELEMAPHSRLMIHDGFALAIGNAADMREMAALLDDASDNIASMYAERTGKPVAYWREKMRAETWYSGEQALAEGLADRVTGSDGGAKPGDWDLSVYAAARKPKKGRKRRYDPDRDGDDDSTAAGDTDHDYVRPDGSPGPKAKPKKSAQAPGGRAALPIRAAAAEVDHSPWDGPAAMSAASKSQDPAAAFRAICAGRRAGPPDEEKSWALPYRKTPDSPPNADGVRNALARLPQTHGLTNAEEARAKLERLMKQVSPGYEADDEIDAALLMSALNIGLEGAR